MPDPVMQGLPTWGSKSPEGRELSVFPGKTQAWVSRVLQTTQGHCQGAEDYSTVLSLALAKPQGTSVWWDTYPPLHSRRAGGHLVRSGVERSENRSGGLREATPLLQPVHKPSEDLTWDVQFWRVTTHTSSPSAISPQICFLHFSNV